jgi:hypothetical protein
MFKKRQGGHAIGDRNALSAAAEKIDHGWFSISPRRQDRAARTQSSHFTQ